MEPRACQNPARPCAQLEQQKSSCAQFKARLCFPTPDLKLAYFHQQQHYPSLTTMNGREWMFYGEP